MLRMLVIAGVLPPVLGSSSGSAPAAATELTTPGGVYADALRRLEKPNLAFSQVAQLVGQNHRMTFLQATWDGGATIVRDLEIKHNGGWLSITDPAHRFDEQWLVLEGALPTGSALSCTGRSPRAGSVSPPTRSSGRRPSS